MPFHVIVKKFRRLRKVEHILKAHAMMVVETVNARMSASLWQVEKEP